MYELTPQRAAFITLSHLTEPDDKVAGKLVQDFGPEFTVEIVRTHARTNWNPEVTQFIKRARPRLHEGIVEEIIANCERHDVTPLIPGDPEWPTERFFALRESAPHVLYVKGNTWALKQETRYVSLVGARAATSYGEHVAGELAADLARDHVVVSGAAYGIDGASHRATVASGGITVAFLAGGVDRPYPAGHSRLIERIADTGAVVSELPPGSAPTKWRFLSRNRLIAALGDATVVVEAGWRSGSLNTAGHAGSLGRPLGAVPGPITSAASNGCHRIIRELGGHLITSADDVRELTGAEFRK